MNPADEVAAKSDQQWESTSRLDLEALERKAVYDRLVAIENREGAVGRLELLLRERMERIDELTAQVDQLRHQNKKLDAEAEHLAAMLRCAPPQVDAA